MKQKTTSNKRAPKELLGEMIQVSDSLSKAATGILRCYDTQKEELTQLKEENKKLKETLSNLNSQSELDYELQTMLGL